MRRVIESEWGRREKENKIKRGGIGATHLVESWRPMPTMLLWVLTRISVTFLGTLERMAALLLWASSKDSARDSSHSSSSIVPGKRKSFCVCWSSAIVIFSLPGRHVASGHRQSSASSYLPASISIIIVFIYQ
jgi:hypothetical protein